MHECYRCGMACDCDGEDVWGLTPDDCECPCDEDGRHDGDGPDDDFDPDPHLCERHEPSCRNCGRGLAHDEPCPPLEVPRA